MTTQASLCNLFSHLYTACIKQAGEGKTYVLGLSGMGGIGKTTLANALYNHLLPGFSEAYCFLDGVSHCAANPKGLIEMQTSMLRRVCGQYCALHITNADEGAKCSQTVSCFFSLDRHLGRYVFSSFDVIHTTMSASPVTAVLLVLHSPLARIAKLWLVPWQSRPTHMQLHIKILAHQDAW